MYRSIIISKIPYYYNFTPRLACVGYEMIDSQRGATRLVGYNHLISNKCEWNKRYGYHQGENTGSRLFTEVKPCWTGLMSGWVTISIKYPVLYSLGSQAGVVDINHAFHLYYNVVCGSSFSRSQPDFEGFLRALRFPPSAKLTPRA